MGIPGLIGYLKNTYTDVVRTGLTTIAISATHLLIDGNCQLYKTNTDPFNAINNETLIDKVLRQFTMTIAQYTVKNIHIFMDGIPPAAKIAEQYKRRAKRMYDDKQFTEEYRDTFEELSYTMASSPSYTIGTDCLRDIDGALKQYSVNNKFSYSGIFKAGEGEQKIFTALRAKTQPVSAIINSVDADVIVLGLLFMRQSPMSELVFHIEIGPTNYYIDISKLYHTIKPILMPFIIGVLMFGTDFFAGIGNQCLSDEILDAFIASAVKHNKRIGQIDFITGDLYLAIDEFKLVLGSVKHLFINRNNSIPPYITYSEQEYEDNHHGLVVSKDVALKKLLLRNQYDLIRSRICETNICNGTCTLCMNDGVGNPAIDKTYLQMMVWTLNYFNGRILDHNLTYQYEFGPDITSLINTCNEFNRVKLTKTPSSFLPYSDYINIFKSIPDDIVYVENPYCNKHPIKSKYQQLLFRV